MKKPDYYQILEVSSDAKLDVIKDAWYKMAHKWHPDKNTSPEAKKMFIQIQEAYDCLRNNYKRLQYDYMIGVKQRPTQQKAPGFNVGMFVRDIALFATVIIFIIMAVKIFSFGKRHYST